MNLAIETAALEFHATMPTWLQDFSFGLLGLIGGLIIVFILISPFVIFCNLIVRSLRDGGKS